MVFDLAAEQRGKVVHRAALLTELLKPINKDRMHTNKQLIRIGARENNALLFYFKDGTTFETDAVIGADVARGHVGEYVLGKEHPAVTAKIAGFWDARALVPIQKAKELLGKGFEPTTCILLTECF
jgi:salicylate hydroxylase